MYFCEAYLGELTGSKHAGYDWCFDSGLELHGPDSRPYGFDAYFIWRDFDKNDEEDMKGIHSVYSDRMREWNPEKYEAARKGKDLGWMDRLDRKKAVTFIKEYYDGKYECVGFGRACNVSNGYPLGIFFLKEKKAKKKK